MAVYYGITYTEEFINYVYDNVDEKDIIKFIKFIKNIENESKIKYSNSIFLS
jgi:hypothetical protein